MVGYKIPCRYCEALVEKNAGMCPECGRVNPAGPTRCPVCRNPVRKQHVNCSHCGLSLKIACPKCKEETFLGDYCQHCDHRLVMVCPNPKCGVEQPLGRDICHACQKPLTDSTQPGRG